MKLPSESPHWKIELDRHDELFTMDVVETGSDGFVSLEFPSGRMVNIQPDSSVRLEMFDCLTGDTTCLVLVDTESGKIQSKATRRGQQTARFIINTPYTSAAVRGPVFDIGADDLLRMGVTEGEVGVD